MKQHTPGPWIVRNTGTSIGVFGRNGTEQVHCDRNAPQQEANARLIASAPELLEALEALLFDYNATLDAYNDYRISSDGMPPVKEDDSAITARTAIAKAKGGTL